MNNPNNAGYLVRVFAFLAIAAVSLSVAQDSDSEHGEEIPGGIYEQRMTAERLAELIIRVDDEAVLEGATWFFHVEGLEAAVVDIKLLESDAAIHAQRCESLCRKSHFRAV